MAQLISEIWAGLRDAGLPEVMLYLPDNSAGRCHWDDTALIGNIRVALLADQDRQIVRILPVDSCVGIGIASPKGIDPSGYRRYVFNRLTRKDDGEPFPPEPAADATPTTPGPVPPPSAAPKTIPPIPAYPEPPPPPPVAKADPVKSRWGVTMKPATGSR